MPQHGVRYKSLQSLYPQKISIAVEGTDIAREKCMGTKVERLHILNLCFAPVHVTVATWNIAISSQYPTISWDDSVYRLIKVAEFDYGIDRPLRVAPNSL